MQNNQPFSELRTELNTVLNDIDMLSMCKLNYETDVKIRRIESQVSGKEFLTLSDTTDLYQIVRNDYNISDTNTFSVNNI